MIHRNLIAPTDAGILMIGPLITSFIEIEIEIYTSRLYLKNTCESIVCENSAIVSRPQWAKMFQCQWSKNVEY